MDHYIDMNGWKRLLDKLKGDEGESRVKKETLIELDNFFQHLPTQVAPRLRRDYEENIIESETLLGELFDKLDLSDKPLLCTLLRLLRSFGYARISQITYNVGQYELARIEQVPIYFPEIGKSKWYDMSPLIPKAGTISWDNIMNHGLVHQEPELFSVCLQLLCQKLQFYSIIINLSQFHNSVDRIKKNGEKVVHKLIELIRDATCDDETRVGLDSFLFQLIMPFSKEHQLEAMIDAIVEDLFIQVQPNEEQAAKMFDLINCCILKRAQLQNLLISKILDHLRCNVISRKRKHNVESSDETLTLENLISNIRDDHYQDLLNRAIEVEISSKKFRISYFSYWIKTVDNILCQKTLKDHNSLKLLSTCSILLVSASHLMNQDLINETTNLMAKIIDYTGPFKQDKLFKVFDPLFLIELTKILSGNTSIMTGFQAPIQEFYKLFLNRYIRFSMIKSDRSEFEKMNKFVEFACDKNIGKDTSHLLQYICIHELASCLEGKVRNKVTETYLESARECGKRLFKFIKRNLAIKNKSIIFENGFADDDIDDTNVDQNCSTDSNKDDEHKKAVVVDTLVSILRIAMVRKDQELLDTYGDILVKLFDFIIFRVEVLIKVTKSGKPGNSHPLDAYLPKLMTLYKENSEMIKGYLTYELIAKLADILLAEEDADQSQTCINGNHKNEKKVVYNQLKSKLEALELRAIESTDVYPLIINKQYGFVVEQSLVNGEIRKEKPCCTNYWNEMKTLYEIYTIVLSSCEYEKYEQVLKQIVSSLVQCDHLNHPEFLYILLILETLIPKHQYENTAGPDKHLECFKEKMSDISTSLLRVAKSVELGPSIHVFTNSGSHKTGKAAQCCTYANCIKIYTQIFNRYPSKYTNVLITDAMQMCVSSNLVQYAKYTHKMQRFFIQLASSITGLLKSMFMFKNEDDVLKPSMPIFLSVFLDLIRCLVLASDKQKLESEHSNTNGHNGTSMDIDENANLYDLSSRKSEFETQLELLAMDMGRILNSLSLLRVKLVDYAPHLISTYVKDIQRASCPDFVKLHLNEGIFRIFNLVDAHQRERLEEIVVAGVQRKTTAGRASGSLFEMIHARLDQASREIFKNMHDDYNRFHRYKGKC